MSFLNDLKEMIDNNVDVGSWITCAQQDEIDKDTKFIIASMEINNGLMCGGDGVECGEWTWFNSVNDIYDYLLNFAIPYNLCALEDQDPFVVMTGDNTENIFSYDYSDANLSVRNDLYNLYNNLQALRKRGADYQAIKEELKASNIRCEKTDGSLIFRFYCFDNYREAGEELLRLYNPLEPKREYIKSIISKDCLSKEDSEFLSKSFVLNGMV